MLWQPLASLLQERLIVGSSAGQKLGAKGAARGPPGGGLSFSPPQDTAPRLLKCSGVHKPPKPPLSWTLGWRVDSTRPLLACLGWRRHAVAGSRFGETLSGKPRGVTSPIGDVIRPRGECGGSHLGGIPDPARDAGAGRESPRIPASLAESCICPAGRSRPRVK